MTIYQNKYRVETARYPGWDYSWPGFYFITICAYNRIMFFGDVVNGEMILSKIGQAAQKCWTEIPKHFPFVVLDEFIVMPNHLHGVLEIIDRRAETRHGASLRRDGNQVQHVVSSRNNNDYKNKFGPLNKNSISSITNHFKGAVTKHAKNNNIPFNWQPRFYDHIVRNQPELGRIRKYIIENPGRWQRDQNNLEGIFI